VTFDLSGWKGRHLDSLVGFSRQDLEGVLALSAALKAAMRTRAVTYTPLTGRTMSMIFQKRSTRTRVSTESGIAELGGHALFLGSEDIQLGKAETLKDTARVLSRYSDVILARVYGHADITALCAESSVPVINALSDLHHPLQGLADLMTLQEAYGRLAGLTLGWVGDGNNITHTLLSAAGTLGFNMRVATPRGYECDAGVVAAARTAAAAGGVSLHFTHTPEEAVAGADVIVTDTWVSMGQETEAAARVAAFAGYQVTEALAARGGAKPDWRFLHCLPRKPHEVDDAVFYSPTRSLVWDEAENRKWTVMAVTLAQVLGTVTVPVPRAAAL